MFNNQTALASYGPTTSFSMNPRPCRAGRHAAARQESVLDNATARACAREYGAALNLVSDDAFAALCRGAPRLYTCSENAPGGYF